MDEGENTFFDLLIFCRYSNLRKRSKEKWMKERTPFLCIDKSRILLIIKMKRGILYHNKIEQMRILKIRPGVKLYNVQMLLKAGESRTCWQRCIKYWVPCHVPSGTRYACMCCSMVCF